MAHLNPGFVLVASRKLLALMKSAAVAFSELSWPQL